MPSTPTSNCAIPRGWSLGEDGWDAGDDLGRQIIDCLLTGTVKNIVTTLPSSGQVLGDTYIMAADAGTHARKLAMWVEDRAAAGYWLYLVPKEGWTFFVVAAGRRYRLVAGPLWVLDTSAGSNIACIPVACSDETTALTTGTAKIKFRMPFAMTLQSVKASLSTAQASGSIFTVDINEAGASILSTKLTIDNTEKTSTTAATAAVMSDTSLDDDSEITIDVDQVGDGTAKGLKVYLIGVPV